MRQGYPGHCVRMGGVTGQTYLPRKDGGPALVVAHMLTFDPPTLPMSKRLNSFNHFRKHFLDTVNPRLAELRIHMENTLGGQALAPEQCERE